MIKPTKRTWMIVTLVLVAGALISLVLTSFSGALVYFYTPSEILAKAGELDNHKLRIGGMVQEGSLQKEENTLKIRFLVTDGKSHLPVYYDGIVPDLFREGQGVVVEGMYKSGQTFEASSILAKHSEDYVPVEMTQEGIAKAKESLIKSLQ
ncbi:MAG: cytochrome c maturation protein CcmE [Magnetococcus sp. DMHC-6]